jgi:hypothetical protein
MSYICNICVKPYKSYQTLWKHNKNFHNDKLLNGPKKSENGPKKSENGPKKSEKNYNCRFCNKIYNNKSSRWSHEQKCSEISNKKLELKIIQEKNLCLKEEAKILQLKLKLEKSNKIDNITLKKLNRMLIDRNNRIKNSTINSNNIINNITNNFQLIGFGKEGIIETLTKNDKKLIIDAKYSCLEKLIEIVHCGKYNQFKNIIITNMKDNYMYKYDDSKGFFVLSTKNEVLNSLIDYRLCDLEVIYNDLLSNNKLDEKTKDIIEKFINKINYEDTKFTDCDGQQHDNYKEYKINEIKILLFNNQDKINNDISLLLTTNEF